MVGNSSENNSQIETLLESVEQFISDEDKIVSFQLKFPQIFYISIENLFDRSPMNFSARQLESTLI